MTARRRKTSAVRGSAPSRPVGCTCPYHVSGERHRTAADCPVHRRGSGGPSEAYYAARGIVRPNIRVDGAVWALLEREAERSGYSCSQLVEEMIRIELDPTHEGYVGPREAVRCMGYVNRVRCDNAATVAASGLCMRCQDLADERSAELSLERSDDDGPDDELSARMGR